MSSMQLMVVVVLVEQKVVMGGVKIRVAVDGGSRVKGVPWKP